MRQLRYRQIADDLRSQIHGGALAAGDLLPSEAELSSAYAASRITVRRALELLREEGLLTSRQGLGWSVVGGQFPQVLGRLGTIEAQLAEAGIESERLILEREIVRASRSQRELLGAERVLRVRRLNLAAGRPFALVTVWCPSKLGRQLTSDRLANATFHELLPVQLGDATQTIEAAEATEQQAERLEMPSGAPTLVCWRVTRDRQGTPVLLSKFVFPADRTRFVVELPRTEPSMAPSGLELLPWAPPTQ